MRAIVTGGDGFIGMELRQLIGAIAAAPGKEPIIRRLPEQPGDVRQTCADVSRATAELGDARKTPIAEGLARYVGRCRLAAS
jgi:UDP-glucuronate 4-epimerase